MARAANVYLVQSLGATIKAFTVKHEMNRWLLAHWQTACIDTVARFPDGDTSRPTTYWKVQTYLNSEQETN